MAVRVPSLVQLSLRALPDDWVIDGVKVHERRAQIREYAKCLIAKNTIYYWSIHKIPMHVMYPKVMILPHSHRIRTNDDVIDIVLKSRQENGEADNRLFTNTHSGMFYPGMKKIDYVCLYLDGELQAINPHEVTMPDWPGILGEVSVIDHWVADIWNELLEDIKLCILYVDPGDANYDLMFEREYTHVDNNTALAVHANNLFERTLVSTIIYMHFSKDTDFGHEFAAIPRIRQRVTEKMPDKKYLDICIDLSIKCDRIEFITK